LAADLVIQPAQQQLHRLVQGSAVIEEQPGRTQIRQAHHAQCADEAERETQQRAAVAL
jgi:hypothetical protein